MITIENKTLTIQGVSEGGPHDGKPIVFKQIIPEGVTIDPSAMDGKHLLANGQLYSLKVANNNVFFHHLRAANPIFIPGEFKPTKIPFGMGNVN